MEMNGIANIKLILEMMKTDLKEGLSNKETLVRDFSKISQQLDYLYSYLAEIKKINKDLQTPAWHDIISKCSNCKCNSNGVGKCKK